MRAFGPRISAYAFWTTTDIHTYIPTDIPREISIEHPSVGLASLAQLLFKENLHTLFSSLEGSNQGNNGILYNVCTDLIRVVSSLKIIEGIYHIS